MFRPLTAASGLILRKSRALIVGAGVVAAVTVLLGGEGVGVERQLRTVRNVVRAHDASGEVHIVEIDKRSIDAIRKWPWPRRYHALAIDRLRAVGVKNIAFDVDFSSDSTPEDDRLLAAALARAEGSVVLPALRQAAGAGSNRYIDSEPIPMLREHAFAGAVSMQPDADGYVRAAPLGMVIKGAPRPSLAALVAEVAAPGTGAFAIDYAIRPNTIPRHSFIDVIEGRTPATELAGKRIIVGATAVETGDRYAVPGHGVIFGVVIQALAAETLMAGRPGDLGWLPPLFLAAAAIALLRSRMRRAVRVAGFVGIGVAVLLMPLMLEAFASTSVGIVPTLAAMFASGLAAAIAAVLGTIRRRTMINAETGLPNLNALAEHVGTSSRALVAVARIEGFAATASACGPAVTADLVRRIAERMGYATRGAVVYRVDEATLAWPVDPNELNDIGGRFDGLAMLMRAPVEAGGRRVDVAMTFGVAVGAGADGRQLVANATHAAGKAAGAGERWQMFTLDNEEDAQWRLSLLGELDAALAAGDLWVAHQAKFDLRTRKVVGSEALVRWQHATRGPIPPDLFIPIVEAQGRLHDLTLHVLKTALRDAVGWRDAGAPMSVAVNISVTLLTQPGFVEEIQAALDYSGLSATMLTLEVTESAAMTGSDGALAALERLRDLGIKLSVDDYGTGQSTLTYLKRLPASELKIDKSFIQTIVANRNDAILVRSTIDLAHELGLSVVGEGVEDAECLEALAALGCDTAQGYHIGKPMPAADFAALAARLNASAAPTALAA